VAKKQKRKLGKHKSSGKEAKKTASKVKFKRYEELCDSLGTRESEKKSIDWLWLEKNNQTIF